MNIQPLSLRGLGEPVVLAQCEAFAVMLTLGELRTSGLGRQVQPPASDRPTATTGPATRSAAALPQMS